MHLKSRKPWIIAAIQSCFRRPFPVKPECPGFHVEEGHPKSCSGEPDQDLVSGDSPCGTPATHGTERVVTLVHGSFARHGSWMRDDSKFCEKLSARFRLSRFCWSGANTHTARLQAGKDLAIHLRRVMKEAPRAKHYVVGHSHGGNVGLYAMEQRESENGPKLGDHENMGGIVTLATPFLVLRKRLLPSFVLPSAWVAIAFAVFASLLIGAIPEKAPTDLRAKEADGIIERATAAAAAADQAKEAADIAASTIADVKYRAFPDESANAAAKKAAESKAAAGESEDKAIAAKNAAVEAIKKATEAKCAAEILAGDTAKFAADTEMDAVAKKAMATAAQAKTAADRVIAGTEKETAAWMATAVIMGLSLLWLFATVCSALWFRGGEFGLKRLFRFLFAERKKPVPGEPESARSGEHFRNEDLEEELEEMLAPLRPAAMNPDRILVIRPLGDEANMGLVVPQFFSWLQNRILRILQSTYDGFLGKSGQSGKSRVRGCLFTAIKPVILIILFFLLLLYFKQMEVLTTPLEYLHPDLPWYVESILAFVMILFIGLLAFFVLFGFVSLIFLLGLSLAALPFGVDAIFWNLFASTTAETSPLGNRPARIFVAGGTATGLAHSGIYEHEDTIQQIIDWILAGEKGPSGSHAPGSRSPKSSRRLKM